MPLLRTPDALADALASIAKGGVLALDTEFVWERTYTPALGLVQLADAEGAVWLVDAVALRDWTPLREALADASLVKVLHDAQQDLTILRGVCGGSPVSVFDTRLAAGFAGLPSTLSLHNLLDTVLGVHLEKGETRSDWLKRPLREAQIHYAEEDVLYLGRVREALLGIVEASGHGGMLAEELARLDDPGLYAERDPGEAYLRFKKLEAYRPRDLAVMQALASWREVEAARRDIPRGHVLDDKTLMQLVREKPTTEAAFRRVRGCPARLFGRYGRVLLERIGEAVSMPEDACPVPPRAVSKAVREEAGAVLEGVKQVCERRGLDAGLVCSRGELQAYLQEGDPAARARHRLGQGWRAALLAEINAGN